MGEVKTSHYRIMEYWKDKQITKDGSIVINNSPIHGAIDVVEDWGEPMCWGCEKPIISDFEKHGDFSGTYGEEQIKAIWSDKKVKSHLNRCHIIPAALGGEDTPSNLFLLCPNCHLFSPDTRNVNAFMRWIYKKRMNSIMGSDLPNIIVRDINEELTDRGLPNLSEMQDKHPELDFSDWKSFLDQDISSHCTTIVHSSFIIGFADMIEDAWKRFGVD